MFVCFVEDTMSYDDLVRADGGRCPRYEYDPMCEREGAVFRWPGKVPYTRTSPRHCFIASIATNGCPSINSGTGLTSVALVHRAG